MFGRSRTLWEIHITFLSTSTRMPAANKGLLSRDFLLKMVHVIMVVTGILGGGVDPKYRLVTVR